MKNLWRREYNNVVLGRSAACRQGPDQNRQNEKPADQRLHVFFFSLVIAGGLHQPMLSVSCELIVFPRSHSLAIPVWIKALRNGRWIRERSSFWVAGLD